MAVVEEAFSINLPVGERFIIKRNRHSSKVNTTNKRVSIVSGIHGDELEGQYVCYLLNTWLEKNSDKLDGIVDIYPSVNSLGIDSITRSIPFYEVDLNRVFPGNKNDFLPAQIADGVVEAIKGSDIAIDIHSSNIFLKELPQIRISNTYAKDLVPLAKKLNIDFVWIHDAVTVLESTFAHAMNTNGTKTLVVEMGVGMRITREYGFQLLDGILNLLHSEGMLRGFEPKEVRLPMISEQDGVVYYLNSNSAGIFVPLIEHCQQVSAGELVGEVMNPLTGAIEEEVYAPGAGMLFTLREYPVVYEGSLLARIFGSVKC